MFVLAGTLSCGSVYSSMASAAPIENQGVADSSNEKSNSQNEHKGEMVISLLSLIGDIH